MDLWRISWLAGQRPTKATMRSRPERADGHIGTETRPRLLREAAVGNFRQWETLTEQRRVSEEGLRVVKLCCKGRTAHTGNGMRVTVLYQKATANYVPAAAVIRRWRALSGIIGRKEGAGGRKGLW